jgi:hypothetical protein
LRVAYRLGYTLYMDTPNLPRTDTLEAKFKAGLRAVFGTTSAESKAQMDAFQAENKKKREAKKKTK